MGYRKRLGVITGQADEEYQRHFIEGFLEQAFASDMDVCVFSMYRKYQDSVEREIAEGNIFRLINPEKLDGIVFLKDSVQTPRLAEEIEARLHNTFHGPVLVIDRKSDHFESIMTDGYQPTYRLMEHLIEHHGFKDIAYLSGKKWHEHAKERLSAYRDAMKDHGLEVSEDRVIFGDFWYTSGEICAKQLLGSPRGLPEAVACANDCMAIGLCRSLTNRGIRVPEDVAVVGFDCTEEGRRSPKPITSPIMPAGANGRYAAEYLDAKIRGTEVPEYKVSTELFIGESCGCQMRSGSADREFRRDRWETEISEEGFRSVYNSMLPNLMNEDTLTGYLQGVYSYLYQLTDVVGFVLCLSEQWKDMEESAEIHSTNMGYAKRMIRAVSYRKDGLENVAGLTESFDTSEMLPELEDPSERPKAFFFTPFYYEDKCFGYAVVGYGDNPRCYDEVYRLWMGHISCGLESVRRNLVIRIMEERNHPVNKFESGRRDEKLSDEEKQEYYLVENLLDHNLFTYHFQPIVRATDGSIYSYEALMRSDTEKKIPPLTIIRYAGMMGRMEDVERATFLNILNKVDSQEELFRDRKVFINSIPGTWLKGEDREKVDAYLARNSATVVVELTEEAELSDEELEATKEHYRSLGIELAVDDYGTGYSNVSNLLRYMPNYVKIDRSLLSEIQIKPQKQHFVREIIEFCHANGILALAEGVETPEELQMVIHLGADLIQGFYTARPSAEVVREIDEKIRREIVSYKQEQMDGQKKHIYKAGRTNRIPLNVLVRDGNTDIIVGAENMVYKDISVIGTPGLKTDIHMIVEPGYEGRITLENVYFSNVKNRPCIELGRDSKVNLVLRGENHFNDGGIRVPESAQFTLEGEGDLEIILNQSGAFGIGNYAGEGHGGITLNQDGELHIVTKGREGICIGSGLGGKLAIQRGKYTLEGNGDRCIGVGAWTGDMDFHIHKCHMEIDMSPTEGVGIGSMDGSVKLEISQTSMKCNLGGHEITMLGTSHGKRMDLSVANSNLSLSQGADIGTVIGALNGESSIHVEKANLALRGTGTGCIVLGGMNEDTDLYLDNVELRTFIQNDPGIITYLKEDRTRMISVIQGHDLNGVNQETLWG